MPTTVSTSQPNLHNSTRRTKSSSTRHRKIRASRVKKFRKRIHPTRKAPLPPKMTPAANGTALASNQENQAPIEEVSLDPLANYHLMSNNGKDIAIMRLKNIIIFSETIILVVLVTNLFYLFMGAMWLIITQPPFDLHKYLCGVVALTLTLRALSTSFFIYLASKLQEFNRRVAEFSSLYYIIVLATYAALQFIDFMIYRQVWEVHGPTGDKVIWLFLPMATIMIKSFGIFVVALYFHTLAYEIKCSRESNAVFEDRASMSSDSTEESTEHGCCC